MCLSPKCLSCQTLQKTAHKCSKLMKSVWYTFTRRREGNRRAYFLILSIAVFFNVVAQAITGGMIISLSPFNWDQNLLSDFKSTASAVSLVGSTLGIFVFKNYFRMPDTLIIVTALISTTIRCAVTAFSNETWMLFVSAAAGLLQPVLMPCV